jgi:frataxin-like iron-binding protein CyaY
MKFVLNKDKLLIQETQYLNSGSINYYEAEVEYDEAWNNLSKEAILIKTGENTGKSIAVVNNKIFIDQDVKGSYSIGFIGYTIENNVKVYQISTKLKTIFFAKGAGEIEVSNSSEVPTPSEWEIYLAQVQEFIDNGNEIINQANNLDVDLEGNILTITKKDGTEESVNTKGEKGDDGQDGQDGYTPIKGTDYWTVQDKSEMENDVITDITPILNNKADKSEIPDVSNFITKDVNNLTYYELKTNTGSSVELSINSSTYVVTLSLKNSAGTILNTQTIDLPLESVVVNGSYDSTNKKIILTLQSGSTIEIPVGDLISGLQTEITSSNKLSSDLVDDTNNTNKFVTATDKTNWDNKGTYSKPSGGIPKTDLDSSVQTSLGKADTALQSHQDISGKEDKSNKVTSLSSNSTDTQYPSAKCVYDIVGNIETLLSEI